MEALDHDHTWTFEKVLREQVEQEAWTALARKEDAPFKSIPPMKSDKWPAAPLHVLRSQLKQLIA